MFVSFYPLANIIFQQDEGAGIFFTLVSCICGLIWAAITIGAFWTIFTKAKQPGWAALIPIYNVIVMLEITGRPTWWVVLFLIPGVNAVMSFLLMHELAKSFGKDIVYTLGLIFLNPIFILLLAFGDAQYVGPGSQL